MADDTIPETWRSKLAKKKGLSAFFNATSRGTDLDAALETTKEIMGTIGFLSDSTAFQTKTDAEKAQDYFEKAQQAVKDKDNDKAARFGLDALRHGYDREKANAFVKNCVEKMVDRLDPNSYWNELERFIGIFRNSKFSDISLSDFLDAPQAHKICQKYGQTEISKDHDMFAENNAVIKKIIELHPDIAAQHKKDIGHYYDQYIALSKRWIIRLCADEDDFYPMRAKKSFVRLRQIPELYPFDHAVFLDSILGDLCKSSHAPQAAALLNSQEFQNEVIFAYTAKADIRPATLQNILMDIAGGRHIESFDKIMLEYGGLFDETQRQEIETHQGKRLMEDAAAALKDGYTHKALSFISEAALVQGLEEECGNFAKAAWHAAQEAMDYKRLLDLCQSGSFRSLMNDSAQKPLLNYDDYKKMLRHFAEKEDLPSLIRLRLIIHESHPEYLEMLQNDGLDFRIRPEQFLHVFAPSITQEDGQAAEIAYLFKHLDHDILAQAQCADLEYIWDALETADPEKTDMPSYNMEALEEGVLEADQEKMIPEGREDIAFTKESLQKLYMDVARYMGIVQLQRPVFFLDKLDVDKMMRDIFRNDQDAFEDMVAVTRYVSGSRTSLLNNSEGEVTASSRFGFFTIKKSEKVDVGDAHYERESLIAMPVITIEDDILKATLDHSGEGILRHFQEMMGIFNHDYFHHLTGRIINPYIHSGSGGINLDKTPYAVMLGKEKMIGPTKANEKSDLDRILYGQNAFGAELSYRFQNEHYGVDPRWRAFKSGNDYEFHALHLHASLYKNWLDGKETGLKMRTHIQGYFQAIDDLSQKLGQDDPEKANRVALYYSKLLYFNMLRIVPHDHELGRMLEKEFAYLGIDKDFMRSHTEEAINNMDKKRQEHILRNAIRITPKENDGEEISLHRHINAGNLDTGDMLRIQAYVCAYQDLDILHKPEYQEAQDYALSAMQRYTSAVQRDMTTIDRRGGLEAFESVIAAQMRTKEKMRNQSDVMENKF